MHTAPHTRRIFIQRGLTMLAAVPTIPLFLDNTVMALNAPDGLRVDQNSGKDGKILVVVQLSGGNDGLNTVIPVGEDAYYRLRPQIAIPANRALRMNEQIALNPVLQPLEPLFKDGLATLIQGVGYPNPNRSHFRSMDIWHTAEPESERITSGWLGRYFDATCVGDDPKTQKLPGVGIGESEILAMRGEKTQPVSFENPGAFRYRGEKRSEFEALNAPTEEVVEEKKPARRGRSLDVVNPSHDELASYLSRTALDAQAVSDRVLSAIEGHTPSQPYPRGEFGDGLRAIAAMIRGELPTRVYYVSLGGFDTHANQGARHDQLLTTFAQGISAFMADLKSINADDRVLVMTFSEFGRRVAQNASQGTDHGAAAPMFLFGSRLRQGIVGKHPSLTDLDAGDLKFAIDFRSIYATILQNWLDTPSKPILGKQFATAPLVNG